MYKIWNLWGHKILIVSFSSPPTPPETYLLQKTKIIFFESTDNYAKVPLFIKRANGLLLCYFQIFPIHSTLSWLPSFDVKHWNQSNTQ